ncbi:MAG TPA: YbjN domain-containing protein [Thermoleophilaceae bacterium]|nr:YbjN domain-containing protein [Thermoleophilaceae bacterium]
MAAADIVDAYVRALPGSARRLGPAQWGVTVESEDEADWPLDIGIRIADGLLRAQARAAGGNERLDPWLFLNWNRQTRLVRFGCARNGDIWVHGDLPVAAVDERAVDRLLGLVAEGAAVGRRYAARSRSR